MIKSSKATKPKVLYFIFFMIVSPKLTKVPHFQGNEGGERFFFDLVPNFYGIQSCPGQAHIVTIRSV